MVIVETYQIERFALEQMVAGRRLVASCRNGARGVEAAHYLGKVLSQQRIHRLFSVLGQRGSRVSGIEYQVGLLKSQSIGLGIRPLFQHFVANRPHQDTRMVTVAQHKVCKVALVPTVEEPGIVVLSLAAAPHIKRLIHDDESHGVAHIQQFGCRRIMAAADGIDTHLLQLHQFAVQCILIQCCSEAAEVMVLADSVELDILAIEPETRLGVEAEIAESGIRPHHIHLFIVYEHLCPHLIYIRVLGRPEMGALYLHPDLITFCIVNSVDNLIILSCHIGGDRHLAVLGIRHHIHSPVLHMHRMSGVEPYMAIDATPAVPP